MDKFEYKLLTISTTHLNKNEFQAELQMKFDEWGNQGWDLVKMESVNDGFFGWSTKFLIVFKRPKK